MHPVEQTVSPGGEWGGGGGGGEAVIRNETRR